VDGWKRRLEYTGGSRKRVPGTGSLHLREEPNSREQTFGNAEADGGELAGLGDKDDVNIIDGGLSASEWGPPAAQWGEEVATAGQQQEVGWLRYNPVGVPTEREVFMNQVLDGKVYRLYLERA
jgi:hypothetical protein